MFANPFTGVAKKEQLFNEKFDEENNVSKENRRGTVQML